MINTFEWQKPSKKQMKVWRWWWPDSPYWNYDGVICDGSVRSGKTIVVAPSFVEWAMKTFDDCNFAICGKTIGALRKNVIDTLLKQMVRMGFQFDEIRTENLITVRLGRRVNRFYLYGGRDERSASLIQGITLAGVYFDEVALMPESFVVQAMARCSVEGAKFWFTCNPDRPSHWFKLQYIDLAEAKRLLYLHFTMDDNPTLSKRTRERYERQFTGVFYQRMVLGLWVAAEGRIYTDFSDEFVIPMKDWKDSDLRKNIFLCTAGIDFGGNGSYHAFNLTGYTKGFKELITLKERRIQATTPQKLDKDFVEFIQDCRKMYPQLNTVYADSAEQVLIRGLKKAARDNKLPIRIVNAQKNEINERIRFYTSMQGQGRHYILSCCPETIQAFKDAVWDPDEDGDVRLDDGSTNIDNLDAQEYSSEAYMTSMIDLGGR